MRPALILLLIALARPADATNYEIYPPDDLWSALLLLAASFLCAVAGRRQRV